MTQPKTPEFQCQAPRMSFIVTIEGTEDQAELENAVAAIGGTLRWVTVEEYSEYDGEGAHGEEWLWSSIEEWLEGLEEDDDGEYETLVEAVGKPFEDFNQKEKRRFMRLLVESGNYLGHNTPTARRVTELVRSMKRDLDRWTGQKPGP